MNYWLMRNGERQGPFSMMDLRQMLFQGAAFGTDMVWGDGMPAWVPLSQVIPATAVAAAAGGSSGVGGVPVQGMPTATATWPVPPSLHWGIVLALSIVTLGLFGFVWLLVIARFARKIDPANKSTLQLLGCLVLIFAAFLFGFVNGLTVARGGEATDVGPVGLVLNMFIAIFSLSAIFGIRKSLEEHYTMREPIQLKLSGAMTFFFNVYYFQYQLSRIAAWKKTGVLSA